VSARPSKGRLLALVLAACAAVAACAPSWKRAPHDEQFQRAPDLVLHRRPALEAVATDWWDRMTSSTLLPLGEAVSPARYVEAAAGGRDALDVNRLGEVPDSTWFENRIGRHPVTAAQIARGPGDWVEPAPGPLTVVSGKLEGATPGFVMRDTAGHIYFVKFDPPAFPELSTGAEIVAQRLLHAAGYLVPDMQVTELALDRLVIDPTSRRRNSYEQVVPMTRDYLDGLLSNLNPTPSRRLRALLSRATPGRSLGPFAYRSVRVDDPNDRIPHERRRSLRGLWVFAAWLNNTDVRQENTLDTFIEVDRRRRLGYVRHQLIDFGDSLGASGERDKYLSEGYEGEFDWAAMGGRLFGFGLRYQDYLSLRRTSYPSVGIFEADLFEPERWRPTYPNPAFDEATRADTFWAAAILAHIDRRAITAAVAAARYSDARAARLIVDVLVARRAKLLRHAFAGFLPLADPSVHGFRIAMTDLAVAARLPGPPGPPRYRYSVRWNRTGRGDCEVERGERGDPALDLGPRVARARRRFGGAFAADPFLTITWQRMRGDRPGPRVELHLRVQSDHVVPVGLWRERD
jgi:hypothetical protein